MWRRDPLLAPRIAPIGSALGSLLLLVGAASLAVGGCRLRREDGSTLGGAQATTSSSAAQSASAPPVSTSLPALRAPVPKEPPSSFPIQSADAGSDPSPEDLVLNAEPPTGAAVIAHGGIGSAPEASDKVLAALHRTLTDLAHSRYAVDASARGVAILEDAPELNAGTGSSIRLDGSVQMDAAVMDSEGGYAAVLAIADVKNPSLVALELLNTPHRILMADGATRFARGRGHPRFDPRIPSARLRRGEALKHFGASLDGGVDWKRLDDRLLATRSDDGGAPPLAAGAGGVAVLVRSKDGGFAGAVSDGGDGHTLGGAAGPVATPGASLFVGPSGAVAVSGRSNTIVREELARRVYDRMKRNGSPKAAAAWGLGQLADGDEAGISAINSISMHSVATGPMAWARWSKGSVQTGALDQP
jgi:beta-aspartyl-peptidase (threonine type)